VTRATELGEAPGADDAIGANAGAGRDPRTLALLALPLLKLLLHLVPRGAGYGHHRDELYYLACADHLDWGYVDHPPFSIAVLAIVRAVFGDSVGAIRVVPALAGAMTVALVGVMARRLGGGRFAQALSMTAALVAPFYLTLGQYFSMNALDLLSWAIAAHLVLRIVQGGSPRLWLLLGAVLGIGVENKLSVLWLCFGLAVGLLLTPHRSLLRTRWPWLGAAIAVALAAPHVAWQVVHGWPTLEFVRNATEHKIVALTPVGFLKSQVKGMFILAAPVWMAGLVFLLLRPGGRAARLLGWSYAAVFVLLAASPAARPVYLAPAYMFLLPAGGVALESWIRGPGRWALGAYIALLAVSGAAAAPFLMPLLPARTLAARLSRPDAVVRSEERSGVGTLPEYLAHMYGWETIVATAKDVHDSLPEAERGRAVILAPNYGVAAAIDVLGRGHGLPPARSGHNSYWLWGPGAAPWDVVIAIGMPEEQLRSWFEDVTRAAETDCGYCMPYENHRPVWIARRPRVPLSVIWAQLKTFV
jgi:MFS family permease